MLNRHFDNVVVEIVEPSAVFIAQAIVGNDYVDCGQSVNRRKAAVPDFVGADNQIDFCRGVEHRFFDADVDEIGIGEAGRRVQAVCRQK